MNGVFGKDERHKTIATLLILILLCLGIALKYRISADTHLLLLFTIMIFEIGVVDRKYMVIPDKLCIMIFILGIIRNFMNLRLIKESLSAVCVFGVIFTAIYLLTKGTMIGGGDVKFVSAVGLFIGFSRLTEALMLGCVICIVVCLVEICCYRKKRPFAFGPYIATGIYLALLM